LKNFESESELALLRDSSIKLANDANKSKIDDLEKELSDIKEEIRDIKFQLQRIQK